MDEPSLMEAQIGIIELMKELDCLFFCKLPLLLQVLIKISSLTVLSHNIAVIDCFIGVYAF